MLSDSAAYVVLTLAIANLALVGWVLFLVKSRSGGASGIAIGLDGRFDAIERNNELLRRQLSDMDRDLRSEISTGVSNGLAVAFDKVQQGTRLQAEQLGTFGTQLAEGLGNVQQAITGQQEQLRDKVEKKLDEIRTGNEAKLEQMRQAVDEQLKSALEKGLEDSFRRVTEQFAQVQQAIGQVQSVTGQIGDLKRLFSNVKARGGWGEAHLQALLDDVLPPGSYETNLRIGDVTGEVVEFALRMPRPGATDDKWLAIDAKFPAEDYDRMVLAGEAGDRDQENAARKALERRIRDEAKRIGSKYVRPPRTVEFAVMYLPSEGLYSEVYRIPGLLEMVRRQHNIMVLAPSSMPGFLHCIRVGHLTLALEQNVAQIGETLAAVKAEWANLGKSLDALARKADTLSNGIKDTQRRTRVVGRTLRTVDALDFERAQQVLGLSEETLLIEADADGEIPVLAPNLGTVLDVSQPRDAAE
jgi:DNA recombination protein RmuC